MDKSKIEKIYLPQLTFTRFIAAILVVAYHYGVDLFPFNTVWIQPIVAKSDNAVSYFFYLSGFVLTISYWTLPTIHFWSFLKKRLARIYPVYFVALLILALFFLIGGTEVSLKYFVSQSLLLDAWYPEFCLKLNYPSWSLSVEMFFYCMFPFFLPFFKGKTLKYTFGFVLSFWVLYLFSDFVFGEKMFSVFEKKEEAFLFLNFFPLFHFNTFLFGILGAIAFLELKNRKRNFSEWSKYVWFFAVLMWVLILGFTPHFIEGHLNSGILCPIYFLFTIGMAFDTSIIAKVFASKPCVYLGNISFGVYILQFPMMVLYHKLSGIERMDSAHFLGYLIFLVLVASVIYSFFEKKVRSWILKH